MQSLYCNSDYRPDNAGCCCSQQSNWNRFDHNCEQLTDTDFSFTNYDEAPRRLEAYRKLGARAEALLHEIGDEARPAFYQLVYYPLRGAELMNRMTLGGQRNRWYARQGRAATNAVRDEVQRCYDSLQVITRGYNSLLGGKWNHMMSMRQNYDGVSAYFNLPHLATHDAAGAPRLALQVAGEDVTGGILSSAYAVRYLKTQLRGTAGRFRNLPDTGGNGRIGRKRFRAVFGHGAQPLARMRRRAPLIGALHVLHHALPLFRHGYQLARIPDRLPDEH